MCEYGRGGQPSKLAGGYFNDCPDEWCLPSAGNHLFPLLVSDSLPQGLSTLDSCAEYFFGLEGMNSYLEKSGSVFTSE